MSETTSDTAPTESPMFRAGWIAVERGWNDASLALPADLEDLAPTRPPLVVVASAADVTVHHSRTLAAVAGAGRNVMLVMFEGEINDDAMKWLGDRVEVVDLSRTCTTRTRRRQSVSPQRRRTVRRSDAARCLGQHHLGWQLLPTDLGRRERVGWRQQPPSATAPRQNHRHPASGGRQVRALLRGRDAEQSYRNDLLDRVLLGSYGGQDYLVIETPIGASDDPERVWTPEATTSFAWHVIRWCEQPSAGDVGKRHGWFKRSAKPPTPPVPQAVCFPGNTSLLLRRLSASKALVAFRYEPSSLQEPVELGSQKPIFFKYWIPLHDWGVFKTWTITAVTSLLRMLHLLQAPGRAELPGRNPQTESSAVEQLKDSLGFSAYGDLAVRAFDERYKRVRSLVLAMGEGP